MTARFEFYENTLQIWTGAACAGLNQDMSVLLADFETLYLAWDNLKYEITEFSQGHMVVRLHDPEHLVMLRLELDGEDPRRAIEQKTRERLDV
jgi:hypothetical protein